MIKKGAEESGSALEEAKVIAAWLDEQAAFDAMRPALREDERYHNKYVAICRHHVVDCDTDKFQLVRRLATKFPDEVVFIANVQKDDPPVELPSPEIES